MVTPAANRPRLDNSPEARALAAAIAIPAHIVQAKGHGHAGTAMALAPLSHVLFSRVMRHSPAHPHWVARDRFVLSAGHASLLLYVQLFLTGYGLTLDDLAASRRFGSLTPGHPERGHTVGVEMSTGPLGQGVASAVGMAVAARRESAIFAGAASVLDPTIWVVAGDGCLEEGVSGEASSLAGTLGLDNLVLVWDDNRVTIDGFTSEAFTEDVRARYRAYGWRVLDIDDADDLDGIEAVLVDATDRSAAHGRPTLVVVRSTIGAPSRAFAGTPAAHSGGFGDEDVAEIMAGLGFAPGSTLEELVTPEALSFTRRAVERGEALEAQWHADRQRWAEEEPEGFGRWERFRAGLDREQALDAITRVERDLAPAGTPLATRKANGAVLAALQPVPAFWGGSADLSGSTNVSVDGDPVSAADPGGEFIRFGIREHAMAAMLTGIALQGPWRPFGSTYLVFSDYQRPSIRLAALMGVPVLYVYTHDSLAVGEDGPTHQPVEQIASLRTVPGLDVVRPADAHEVTAVWHRLIERQAGPTALVLSRQDLPVLDHRPGLVESVGKGGYVAWQAGDGSELALIATGSEVSLAIEAARALGKEGVAARVVSVPCVEWFVAEGQDYIDTVLPPELTARVAVEAGSADAWWRFAGTGGEVVGVDSFGESGSGAEVMAARGITVDAVVAAARRTLARA